ncbi:hypothetical protein EDD11_000257 [Mortierella claussenii]|nr:hypothetical protein EDD11_000257 [Mortierella claussenii]
MPSPSGKAKYYAEHHSKINSITLSVQVPPSGLTCTVGPDAVDLIPCHHSPNIHQEADAVQEHNVEKILLPALVMPTKTTLDPSSSQSSLLTLKLAALPTTQPGSSSLTALSGSEFPPAPLPASQLQGLQTVGCGCCGALLLKSDDLKSQPIERVVDLPSEHWQELVDCWMCHEEDFTELREGDLGARLGQALVGGTYFLIHAANVDQGAVVIEDDAAAVDLTWLEDGTDLEMIQVKFHKYMVVSRGTAGSTQEPLSIPRQRFASYVAAEIFESARHHATYRFILQDRLNGQDMILLWMLNWDSTIITNQEPILDKQILWDASLQPDLVDDASTRPRSAGAAKVMKVLYLQALSREQEAVQTMEGAYSKEMVLWDKWRGDPGVEKLQFQKTLLLGLLTMLEQSTRCQPPSISDNASTVLAMDGMRVGAIEI